MAEEISPYFTSVVFWCHRDQFDTIALLLSPSPRLTTGSRTRSSLSTPASPESSSATCGPSLQQSWRTEEWLLLTPWVSKRPRSFCVSSVFSTSRHVCQVLPDFFAINPLTHIGALFLIYEMHLQPQKLVLVLVSFLIPLFFPVIYLWHCDSRHLNFELHFCSVRNKNVMRVGNVTVLHLSKVWRGLWNAPFPLYPSLHDVNPQCLIC